MVLGWLDSGPSPARPRTRVGPVSQELPTAVHFGARSVGSKAALTAPAGVTVRLRLVVRVVEPEVPVTVMVEVPVVAVAEAVKVRVEAALPFAGGVTEPGANEAVTPLGRPEAERATAELKPLTLLTVMLLVPPVPWVRVSVDGLADSE